jgi:hypothetical protein
MTTPGLPRDDLAAALAARRELGPDYDEAFIESVVDRIEETLAARQTAMDRSGRRGRGASPGAVEVKVKGERDHGVALAIVSLVTAIPLTAIGAESVGFAGLLVVWIGIVLVNIAYNWSR